MSKALKIGIDIRDLRIAKTGTKTYLEELCKAFRRRQNDHQLVFYFIDTLIPVYNGKNKLLRLVEQFRFLGWKQCTLPIIALIRNCDILFCTDYFVPFFNFGMIQVPVFHDAFFWEYPTHYNRYWLLLFKKLAIPAAGRSPIIITTTQYARDRIAYYSGINSEKIIPVYEAPKEIANLPETTISNELKEKLATTIPYFLHVGSFEKRKNLGILFKALKSINQKGGSVYSLVLVGGSGPKSDMDDTPHIQTLIEEYAAFVPVLRTGYVPDHLLPALYQNAFAYVFPSINEGFGLPILEAFKYKIPVLVSDNTCLPEVGGNAVISFDPFSEADLTKKMLSFINTPDLRLELISKGTQRLSLFSWDKAASEILEIFEKIVKQKNDQQ